MKKRILLTGASGQIGQNIVQFLSKQSQNELIATDLREPNYSSVIANESLDVLDEKRLSKLIEQYEIKEIYHLAALLSARGEQKPQLAWDVNINGLLHVLNQAKEHNCKVFWPSSIAVFGPNSPRVNSPQHCILEPTTVYGISKLAGELWCKYYNDHFGVDVRSVRLPGIISWSGEAGGGTTDYAVEIFHSAIQTNQYSCFLNENTYLPMLYMQDALEGIIQLMNTDVNTLSVNTSYNIGAMSFSPKELAAEIQHHLPDFKMTYQIDFRQQIADSWPNSVDDQLARQDWNWNPKFDIQSMTSDMIKHLKKV